MTTTAGSREREDTGMWRRFRRRGTVLLAVLLAVLGVVLGLTTAAQASAADNPYQRGPDPTPAGVAADHGTFATAQTTVPKGNGFGGGVVYYPTDTTAGTFGAIAIAPGYGTEWRWYAWLGPRLASFGFVVVGIETNSLDDYADARADQLLAALDWLVTSSPVRDRVDRNRLAVGGHSMGGGGALVAGTRRPSLLTAVGMAPYVPNGNLSGIKIPTVLFGGQTDTTVTPSYLASAYATIPATTQRAYPEIAGEGHGFAAGGGGGNSGAFARVMMVWLKVFMDADTRYSPFLCPSLSDMRGISKYQASCPLGPPGGTQPPPETSRLVNANAGRCLDVPGQAQANGTQVALWDCNSGNNQQWTTTAGRQLQVYGSKCLGADGPSPGAKAVIGDCAGGTAQQWNSNADGTITSVQSGLCLDASGAGTVNGTKVIVWTCNGGANQRWNRS
ncbi:ricin-type beta-trefoil lectin domain protein [Amycolatopsis sp. cmx-4-61]|uniref:poly(ethylene terephthalate) hydrolase family protein n=1 Tax=Amycolatopsis sp. cmx-4-61 TaxID=2790937 RepID=UPI00397B6744